MDDKTLDMLGDRDAQGLFTERGDLLPCPKCKGEELTITGNGMTNADKIRAMDNNGPCCFLDDSRSYGMAKFQHCKRR